jgi:hypothetical protein
MKRKKHRGMELRAASGICEDDFEMETAGMELQTNERSLAAARFGHFSEQKAGW